MPINEGKCFSAVNRSHHHDNADRNNLDSPTGSPAQSGHRIACRHGFWPDVDPPGKAHDTWSRHISTTRTSISGAPYDGAARHSTT